MVLGVVLAAAAAANSPTATSTDFGVREIGSLSLSTEQRPSLEVHRSLTASASSGRRPVNLSAIAAIGSAWGRVTSTYRSPERNRRVGGVRNSFHLSGRAIDIARRPGVSHSAIAAAYRNAGYQLIESLDEGDHSHFAFGSGEQRRRAVFATQASSGASAAGTQWKIVTAPR
jgi:hypothetical protein